MLWQQLQEVPKVNNVLSLFCFALNVILPGFGTVIAACAVEEELVSKTQVVIGFLQFATSVFVVGWIWSIYWGWLIF